MERSFSFKRGWKQLRLKDAGVARVLIMDALGLTNSASFYYRLNGKCEPTVSEAFKIEAVFKKFGIKDVWGDE